MLSELSETFELWERKPTNTEILVDLLKKKGLGLSRLNEFRDIYRVQPKITGIERRSALCYLSRSGCEDIRGTYNNRSYVGIDLLNSVSELVEKGVEIEISDNDIYLWVYVKG